MTSTIVKSADSAYRRVEVAGAVAFLPGLLRRRVQAAEPRFLFADSWAAAADLARATGGGVILADPTDDGGSTGHAMAELCEQVPSVIPVAYSRLTPQLVGHLRRLARFEFSDVIITDYDDTPRRFVELADLAHARSLTGHVLHYLEPALATASAQVRTAVRDLFYSPSRYRSVDDLAAAASMPRRSLYRNLESLGLASPRLLIAASRVVRAIGLLRDPERTLGDVARSLGYSKSDHLADIVALLTGLRVRDARRADVAALAPVIGARLVATPTERLLRG